MEISNRLRAFLQYCTLDLPGWHLLNEMAERSYLNLKKGGLNCKIDFIVNGECKVSSDDLQKRIPEANFYHSDGRSLGMGIIKAGEIALNEGEKIFYTGGCTTLLGINGLAIMEKELTAKLSNLPAAITVDDLPYPLPLSLANHYNLFNKNYCDSIENVKTYCNRYGLNTDNDGALISNKSSGANSPADRLGHFMATSDFTQTFPPIIDPVPSDFSWRLNELKQTPRPTPIPLWLRRTLFEGEIRYATRAAESKSVATYKTHSTYMHRAHSITFRIWELGLQNIIQ